MAARGEAGVQAQLVRRLAGVALRKRRVSLLLGTDADIPRETRVALTPRHIARLGEDLKSCGIEPRLLVIEGAGARAGADGGFPDAAYADAGATVVTRARLADVAPLDVVHALKEPSAYESELPGPFLRLGALHLASKPRGVCAMLARRNFAALLDGGTVGNCSYLHTGGDRTPIVASMSRFAGTVAALKLLVGLAENGLERGKVVVVGGGIAGLSAIQTVRPHAAELIVVERYPQARERLTRELRRLGVEHFAIIPELTDEALTDAVGVIFAHRSGARAAEKVCDIEQIHHMRPGAAVIDIAIDQGGSIYHPGYDENDDVETALVKFRELLAGYYYYAETNMPREQPREASETHGDSALPYLTALLALCGMHGGPREATQALLEQHVRVCSRPAQVRDMDLLGCLLQDLRNGVQLAIADGAVEIPHPDIAKDLALAAWIDACARG